MLNIKSLTSGIAATALVSAIGLAYAQTSTEAPAAQTGAPATTDTSTLPSSPPPAESTMPATTPSTTTAPATPATPSTGGTVDSSNDGSMLAPKADRN